MVVQEISFCILKNDKIRIDKFLSELLSVSRNRIQYNLQQDNILINGMPVVKNSFKNYNVKDVIDIELEPLDELSLKAENIVLNIHFENEDFLIINKPAGMVVHPAPGHYHGTMMNAVLYHLGNSKNSSIRPGLLHRIDKNTSGLLVVAKNENFFNEMSKKFASHQIIRQYTALIWTHLKEKTGKIVTTHGRDPKNRKRFSPDTNSTRKAISYYRVEEEYTHGSKLFLSLETGRTHQIRMHMKYLNHPIINDEMYGGKRSSPSTILNSCLKKYPRHMLHAGILGFSYNKNDFLFHIDPPEDMQQVENTLKEIT